MSAELISIDFSRPNSNVHFQDHGQSGWLGGISEIYAHLFTELFVKQNLGGVIKRPA